MFCPGLLRNFACMLPRRTERHAPSAHQETFFGEAGWKAVTVASTAAYYPMTADILASPNLQAPGDACKPLNRKVL
jgi:hypothetical protein